MSKAWAFRFTAPEYNGYTVVRSALSEVGEPVIQIDNHDAGEYSLPVKVGSRRAVVLQAMLAGFVKMGLIYSAEYKADYDDSEWYPVA